MSTDTTLWIPPLSPKDQKQFKKQQKHRKQRLIKWLDISDKNLWDWLQLIAVLAVPVAIAIGTMWFSAQQSQTSEQASKSQHQTDLQIANDQQQETALQTYLDRMSDLLLNNKLRESRPGDEVRNVARARTLTILPQLNGTRKRELVQFLYEAGLIDHRNVIISLDSANLRGADLSYTILSGADLSYANLYGANLSYTNLSFANLHGAFLSYANLSFANLHGADLSETTLSRAFLFAVTLSSADLSGANLSGANLSIALLSSVNLSGAFLINAKLSGTDISAGNLSGAFLINANLIDANLNSANVSKADLSGADLSNANLSEANLSNTYIRGTKMSNGTNLRGTKLEGAKYSLHNSTPYTIKVIPNKDKLIIGPTQWPKGFDPKAHGVICIDCKK